MSISLILLQVTATAAHPDPAAIVANARTLTSAAPQCRSENRDDIMVCGRRDADRYRVPLVIVSAGDTAHEGVPAERERLLHRTTPMQDMGPFLVGGGMVGMTYSTKGGLGTVEQRPIAP